MSLTDAELDALLRPAQASAPIDPYGAPIDPYGVSDADLDELLLAPSPTVVPEPAPAPAPPPEPEVEVLQGAVEAGGAPGAVDPALVVAAEAGDKEAQALLQQHAAESAPLPQSDQSRWQLPQLRGAPGQSQAIVTQTPQEAGPVDAMAALAALPDDQLIAAIENSDPERRGEMIANLPPERRQVWVQHDNARRQAFADARMDEELREKEADLAEATAKSAEYRQKADAMIAQIAHDAETMQREPLDRRSDFQKTLDSLGSAWGAVMALTYGGRNTVADRVQASIETDLNRQRIAINTNIRSLENRKGIVNKLYEQSGDLDQAVHTARILMYKQAQEKVAQEMARFDPANTRARTHAQELINLRQKEAEAMAAARESAHKRAESAANLWLKTRKEDREDRRLAWQMAGKPGAGGTGSGGSKKPATVVDDNSMANTLAKFPDIKPWAEMDWREQESFRDRMLMVNGRPAVIRFGSGPEAGKIRKRVADSMEFVNLSNELLGMLRVHGWEAGFGRLKSKEGARMQSIYNRLVGLSKGESILALGVLTGPDLDIVKGFQGADPADLRFDKNQDALAQAAKSLVMGVNAQFAPYQVEHAPGQPARFAPARHSSVKKAPKIGDAFLRAERVLDDLESGKSTASEVNSVMVDLRDLIGDRATTSNERARLQKTLKRYRKLVSEDDRKRWLDGVPAGRRSEFIDTISEAINPNKVTGPDLAAEMERDLGGGTKRDEKIDKELTAANIEAKRAQGVPEDDLHLLFSRKSKKLRQKWGRKYDRTWTDAAWLDYMRRREKNSAAKPPK